MRTTYLGASDVGQIRSSNEDAFLLAPDVGLVAVADGMGGYKCGDVASQLACNVVKETILSQRAILTEYERNPTAHNRGLVTSLLEAACHRACEEVYVAGQSIAGDGGRMGTTLDVALVVDNTAFIAHVGDGRIYLFRGSEAHQLTEDHSLVQRQLRDGVITPEEARKARFKNVVTRALGIFPSVMVDTLHFRIEVGDRIVLCSDGLYRYVGLRELTFTLGGEVDGDTPGRLLNMANVRGGRDNVTVVIVRADVDDGAVAAEADGDRLEVLRRVSLFQFCTYRELMQVMAVAPERSVPADTVLFREGDRGRELFILLKGKVVIEKEGIPLAEVEPPRHFGEMSFIDQPERSATARTVADSVFLVIRRDQFMQMMKKDSELAAKVSWQLLTQLSRVLRETNKKAVADTLLLDDDFMSEDDS